MPSFQITLSPSRRAAGRFVHAVRKAIQRALAEERKKGGLTQSEIARRIGVHRSVITRQITGREDISLSRVAEFAFAIGRTPHFELREKTQTVGANATPTTTDEPLANAVSKMPRPSQANVQSTDANVFLGTAVAA